MFTQKELIILRDGAERESKIESQNPLWTRAYQQLADAADRLEAMIARTVVEAPDDK